MAHLSRFGAALQADVRCGDRGGNGNALLDEMLVRNEIVFRRYGPELADIVRIFPDNVLPDTDKRTTNENRTCRSRPTTSRC